MTVSIPSDAWTGQTSMTGMHLSWLCDAERSHAEAWGRSLTVHLHEHGRYESGPWNIVKAIYEVVFVITLILALHSRHTF